MFILLDDFCKAFRTWQESKQMGNVLKRAGRPSGLSESEVLTILIYYHYSGYKHSIVGLSHKDSKRTILKQKGE
jgi:hypothetical protein